MKKQNPTIYSIEETCLIQKEIHRLKSKDEKQYSISMELGKSRSSYPNFSQSGFQPKTDQKQQRTSLHIG